MRLPGHLAIIMDGNGRWAESRHQPRPEGHREGAEAVRRIVRHCRRIGIPRLTLFAFSEQNWDRPDEEVAALMTLLVDFLLSEREELHERQIRLCAIGRLDKLPSQVRQTLDRLVEETREHKEMTLCLALSYGGREEITDATKELCEKVAQGLICPEEVTVDLLGSKLQSMEEGPVDLLIRTGGERRVSNFLLWGAAYAELVFSEALWPDFTDEHLDQALHEFGRRERRFGKVLSLADSAVGS